MHWALRYDAGSAFACLLASYKAAGDAEADSDLEAIQSEIQIPKIPPRHIQTTRQKDLQTGIWARDAV